MDIIMKLAVVIGWFSVVVVTAIACWSGIIWLLNRKIINEKGAAAICFSVVFIAILLCSRYN